MERETKEATERLELWQGSQEKLKNVNHLHILRTIIQKAGFVLRNVPGDGNCQFHAIGVELHKLGFEFSALELRQLVVDTLRTDLSFGYVPEEYIQNMAKPGVWGDGITLAALAAAFQIRIEVFQPDERAPRQEVSPTGETHQTIHITGIHGRALDETK